MVLRKFMVSGAALLGVALVFGSANAMAQPPAEGGQGARRAGRGQGAGGRGQQQMGGMMVIPGAFRAVNPTPEQQQKFEALQSQMQQEMMGLRDMQPQERGPKMRELNTKFQADVEALLTPEQKTKFQAEMKLRATPEGRLIAALDPLNLTDEQKTKIEPIAKETSVALQTAMQNRDGQGNPREKMQEIFDGFKSKVRPLLTPDQQTKLDTMDARAFMGGGMRRPGGGQGRPNP
jgi:Spy/CpxP family protein refolding chaperone